MTKSDHMPRFRARLGGAIVGVAVIVATSSSCSDGTARNEDHTTPRLPTPSIEVLDSNASTELTFPGTGSTHQGYGSLLSIIIPDASGK